MDITGYAAPDATDKQLAGLGRIEDYAPAQLVALWRDGRTQHIGFSAHVNCTEAQLEKTAWSVLREEWETDEYTRLVLVEWIEP